MSESVQPSLLEQLRQRVQQDFAPAPMSTSERLAAFGRGVLSSRGSFLDNLSAGLAGQQQAEAARREEGRKAAEIQAAMLERDRRAQLEKAKFAEETNPESLQGRERLARIRSYEAQAAASGRPSYREFIDQATGDVVLFNERTGQLMPQAGMRPVRSEIANAATERAFIQAATTAARTAVENAVRNGQVATGDQAGQNRIYQEAFQRALRQAQEAASRGGQGSPASTGAPAQGPSQRFQYQPPQ